MTFFVNVKQDIFFIDIHKYVKYSYYDFIDIALKICKSVS